MWCDEDEKPFGAFRLGAACDEVPFGANELGADGSLGACGMEQFGGCRSLWCDDVEKPFGAFRLGAACEDEVPFGANELGAAGSLDVFSACGTEPFGANELGACCLSTKRAKWRRLSWQVGRRIARARLLRLKRSWSERARRAWHKNPYDVIIELVEGLSTVHEWVEVRSVASLALCRNLERWVCMDSLEMWATVGILCFSPDRSMVKINLRNDVA